MAESLLGFAALAVVSGMPASGARLLAAAAALGGQNITSEWAATRIEYEHYSSRARAGLTEQAFASEQAAGHALSLEKAIGEAAEIGRRVKARERAQDELNALTPREREVATLIARAMSNPEIAEELVISKRTAETHVSNIRSKLGFNKRAQIVRWALESGLVERPNAPLSD